MATKRTPVKPVDKTPASSKAMDSLTAGTTLVHEIPIDLIDPHPRNPRRDLGELGELAESIRAHGIKQPPTVVAHPDDAGRFLTVCGHRRIAAARIAGRTMVPVLVDDDMDETEQLEVMLVENLQRVDLTISEEGDGYQGLLDLGVPKATIVRRTGRAKNTVETRLRVAGLPDPVRRHVDHHQLTIEDALVFADWKDAYPDVWEDQLEKLSNPHVMVDVVFGEAKRVVTERQALVKARTDLEAAGYKLIVGERMIPYNDPRSIGRLGISYTEHAHCPGAEVHITGSSKDWFDNALRWGTHLCADPEKHHPDAYNDTDTRSDERTVIVTDQQKQWREEHERRDAERTARLAVEEARRTWLAQTLTRQGKDAAPAYAALADCAAQVAYLLITFDDMSSERGLFSYNGFEASTGLPEGAVLPTNPLALMTLTMLLGLEYVLPDADFIDSGWCSPDLDAIVAYLTTCGEHGHELHESEQALVDAAKAALEAQAEAAETATPDVDDADPADGA